MKPGETKDPYSEKEAKRHKSSTALAKKNTPLPAVPSSSKTTDNELSRDTPDETSDIRTLQVEDPMLIDPEESDTAAPRQLISEENVPSFGILRKLRTQLTRAEHNSAKLRTLLDDRHLLKELTPKRFPLNLPDTPIHSQLQ